MADAPADTEIPDAATLRRRVLERVRYEQSLGIEVVPRMTLAAPVAPSAPVAVARPTVAAVNTTAATTAASRPVVPVRQPTLSAGRAPVQAAVPAITGSVINAADKEARWRDLEARAMGCVSCVLHQARNHVVFGTGNRSAKLVFVGEGPGQDEDLQGIPFVGKAGQLLDKIIGAMKLQREDVYICNVVKCRPPGNRTPLPDEIAACSPFLAEQLELIAPQVIVALGGPAAKTLLRTDAGITALRGRWQSYKSIPVMPTFHPAFVLRTYTDEVRRQVWDDMKQVMAKLQ